MTNKNDQDTKHWQLASSFFEKNYQLNTADLPQNSEFNAFDSHIKIKITKLFANKDQGITLLDEPVVVLIDSATNKDLSGLSIDSYKLIELIAHGGMSSVYRGRKTESHTQKDVAIKLIPTNLQTNKSTSLFKHELETLAKLHHPNIISMHHGDISTSGIPYLVMELVEGAMQIDHYFSQQKTKQHDIIEQFITLCQVITYAHQNGIIHQDIKPSNVLVDAHGHLLVVDFGVAALTEVIPEHHAYTLNYAAPEQTTEKSLPKPSFDIYALTSLLIKCLSQCSDSQPGWQASVIKQLPVDSDLRMILRKGIEEQAINRYHQASEMAMDLSLWQKNLPISHLRNNPFYRIKKVIQRHPTITILASLAISSMAIGLIFYQQQFQRALIETQKAQQIKNILIEAIDQNDPDVSKGNQLTVRDMLKQVELSHAENPTSDTSTSKELYLTLAQAFNKLGDYESTEKNIQKVLDTEPQNTEALLELAELKAQQKQVDQATKLLSRLNLPVLNTSTENTVRYHLIDANLSVINSDYDAAEKKYAQAQLMAEQSKLPNLKIKVMAAHANGLMEQHRIGLAIEKLKQAILLNHSQLGEHHSQSLALKAKLAETYLSSDSEGVKKAIVLFEELIPQQKALLGNRHPNVAKSLFLNATAYRSMNKLTPARDNARQALSIVEEQLGSKHIFTGKVLMTLGAIYLTEKNYKEATTHARKAVENHESHLGAEHPETLQYKTSYVAILVEDQQYDKALKLLLEIHPIQTKKLGANHRGTLFVDIVLSKTYTALGRFEEGVLAGERCHNNAQKAETGTTMQVYCAITLEKAYFTNQQYVESEVLIERYQNDPLVTNRAKAVQQFKDHSQYIRQLKKG